MSGWAVYFLEFLTHFPVRRRPERNGNFLVGCNSGYRASMLRSVGFPDQTLGEDVLFSRRIQESGFDVVYDPGIEVLHHNRQGWGEFFAYNRKMGQSAAAYHRELRRWWIGPFFRFPVLTFVAPLVILPTVAMRLLRARWLYLTRFLLLAPMCLAGNLVWAAAFRREVRRARQFSV
jgi:GT2 family glycosyltransferase